MKKNISEKNAYGKSTCVHERVINYVCYQLYAHSRRGKKIYDVFSSKKENTFVWEVKYFRVCTILRVYKSVGEPVLFRKVSSVSREFVIGR